MKNRRIVILVLTLLLISSILPTPVSADEENRWNMGSVVNTGKDNGYSGWGSIKSDDPHYGWTLGQFYVEGYSGRKIDADGNTIFLKNVGDEVKLMFDLYQDINKLNGDSDLYICEDTNGYMEKYQIEENNLKKGTLIIRHTDYQNKIGEPQIYTNYLESKESGGADTEVLLCEEGDYEICLVYEIMSDGFWFFNGYTNYKIEFKFSVRNGNTMIFPFETTTNRELTNSSFTENGFYLDLANSRYLTIEVKRDVWTKGTEEWVKDTRFNRVVKDGEKYTEDGIYTITVTNPYTDAKTEKIIYVGSNSILKAHVATGLSLTDIEAKIAEGATIDENGNIIPLSVTNPNSNKNEEESGENNLKESESKENVVNDNSDSSGNGLVIVIVICVIVAGCGVGGFFVYKRKKKTENQNNFYVL